MAANPRPHCIKRRMLYACAQAYAPELATVGRKAGWIAPPRVIRRLAPIVGAPIDQALVGRIAEGVLVAFRGSVSPFDPADADGWVVLLDWLNDANAVCLPGKSYAGAGVHWGFAESMRRLWEDADGLPGIRSAIAALLAEGAPRRLFVTGHSKGGALANLAAFRAARLSQWADMPIEVQTVGAARAGNRDFAAAYAATRIRCRRYEVAFDLIPHLPPGPGTPRWALLLLRKLGPPVSGMSDYHPVGTRYPPESSRAHWLDEWVRHVGDILRQKGLDLASVSPAAFTAHAICADSGYDRLVCIGEPECGHGARAEAA